jgi:N-succinyldiaminopimelate aminotransferase
VATIKQFLTYSGGAPFQPAIARALTEGDADICELRDSLTHRRDLLSSALADIGFAVGQPGGTYFVCADATPFLSAEVPDGAAFARALPAWAGVACVPVSAFCREGSTTARELANWVRFTFVKDEATLREAIHRLRRSLTPTAASS